MMENKLNVKGIYSKGYGTISKLVMQDTNISCIAKAIYSYFCSYTGGGDTCFPSRDRICYHLGISKNCFTKHLKQLVEAGYIGVEQVKENGKFSHNIYTVLNTVSTVSQITVSHNTVSHFVGHQQMGTNNNSINNNSINNNSINNIKSNTKVLDNFVISLPTNKFNTQNEEYHVTHEFYQTMSELYTNANVMDELKKMKAWLLTNTQKRKTLKGMEKFINSWLIKKHDSNTTYINSNNNRNNLQNKHSLNKDYSTGWD